MQYAQSSTTDETHLKEALQPPNLENTLSNDYSQLEDTPPLHPTVRALCGIPVHPLTDHNVRLLIPDLREGVGQLADYIVPGDQLQSLFYGWTQVHVHWLSYLPPPEGPPTSPTLARRRYRGH